MNLWRRTLWGFAVTVAWARIGSLVQQAPAGRFRDGMENDLLFRMSNHSVTY